MGIVKEDLNLPQDFYALTQEETRSHLSLNELIDDHTKRSIAMDNHVPEVILILLILVALLTLSVTGYSSGLRGKRLKALRIILVILITSTLAVIIDLDRPRRGLIRVSEDGMIRLKQELNNFHQRVSEL